MVCLDFIHSFSFSHKEKINKELYLIAYLLIKRFDRDNNPDLITTFGK